MPEAQKEVLADRSNQVFVSAATAWELAIKKFKGKLVLAESATSRIARYGFTELPITIQHGEAAAELDWTHRDPFDRMLVAQAKVEGLTLVTADRRIREYFQDCL